MMLLSEAEAALAAERHARDLIRIQYIELLRKYQALDTGYEVVCRGRTDAAWRNAELQREVEALRAMPKMPRLVLLWQAIRPRR